MIKTTFKNFELRAIHAGEKNPVWKDGQDRTHCHHVIRVKDMETKKFFSFDYWTSLANPEIADKKEVLQAFECFLNDCLVATDTLENFTSEFGYEEKEARRIYAVCGRSLKKIERLYEDSIVDLANELSEYISDLSA